MLQRVTKVHLKSRKGPVDASVNAEGSIGARARSFGIIILADRRIVEQAPPGPLFSEPSDERTRRFLRRIVDAGRL